MWGLWVWRDVARGLCLGADCPVPPLRCCRSQTSVWEHRGATKGCWAGEWHDQPCLFRRELCYFVQLCYWRWRSGPGRLKNPCENGQSWDNERGRKHNILKSANQCRWSSSHLQITTAVCVDQQAETNFQIYHPTWGWNLTPLNVCSISDCLSTSLPSLLPIYSSG